MSLGFICDACGETLLAESDVRYLLKIQGYAAYDPMEITRDDLERDFDAEIEKLMEKMSGSDPQILQDEVYKEFKLDLCPSCWKEYRKDPLQGFRELLERNRRAEPDDRGLLPEA